MTRLAPFKTSRRCKPCCVATTPADVLALKHLRQARPLGTADLFRALAQFAPSREMLHQRRGPKGPAPFRLQRAGSGKERPSPVGR